MRTTDADPPRIAPVVARAFARDPLFLFVEPDDAVRHRFLVPFFEALAWRSHLYAEAFLATDSSGAPLGASLWKGPDLHELTPAQLRRSGLDRVEAALSPSARERFDRAFGRIGPLVDAAAPRARWYLGVLAVAPEAQGRGLGGELMRPILERADRERLPVTLETASARNVALYARFGFETVVSEEIVGGGPRFWVLRREPR